MGPYLRIVFMLKVTKPTEAKTLASKAVRAKGGTGAMLPTFVVPEKW